MHCVYCGTKDSRVVDSRHLANNGVRRRRECAACGRRFTTHEVALPIELRVIKAHGRDPEEFQKSKLLHCLRRVCKGIPIPEDALVNVTRTIESSLFDKKVTAIQSREIAEMLITELAVLNKTALDRFAINYRDHQPAEQEQRATEQIKLF